MMESVGVSLANGDHSDDEIERPSSPTSSAQCDSKNENIAGSRIDYLESSSLEVSNCESTEPASKTMHFPSLLKSTTQQPTRKRGFLASDLSNSDKQAYFLTSSSKTSPSHSSSVSSSSPVSTGSSCNRDEVSSSNKRDEYEISDNLIAKRARTNALVPEEDRYGMPNSNSERCTSDCLTPSLNSKSKYRPRFNVTAGRKGLLEPPENSPEIRCPIIATDDNGGRCLNLPRLANRETGKVSVLNSSRVRGLKTGPKGTVLPNPGHRVQKKETLTGHASGIDDELERELPGGSELTIAAYNNFVRRVVDDTLDRNITFCEQPRHAITALENICARAWPTLDMKRHRNRIRAYLKACRRNSKKNRGQINMKEPAMNGLSIEARQLVANALSLVSGEVEQLKLLIQDTNKSGFPPNSSSPGSSKDTIDSHYLVSTPTFGPKHKRTDTTAMCSDQTLAAPDWCNHSTGLSRSNVFDKDYPGPPPLLAHPTAYQEVSQMPISSYGPSGGPYISPLPHSLDASYMAVMLRLLPTLMHYNKPYSSTTSQPAYNSLISSQMNIHSSVKGYETSAKGDCSKTGILNNFDAQQLPFVSTFYGGSEPENRNASFSDEPVARNHHEISDYHSFISHADTEGSRQDKRITVGNLEPPPAHMNSIQYSPTLQEAIGKLLGLDVRLTQDDTAYFRHNLTLAQEAIKYAKAFSHMVLRKIEILEAQLQQPSQTRSQFNEPHPLNLS